MVNLFNLLIISLTMVALFVCIFDQFHLKPNRRRVSKRFEPANSTSKLLISSPPKAVKLCYVALYVLLPVVVLRSFVLEPYNIPTESMLPTFESGDKVLIEKISYGLHEPLFHKQLLVLGKPKRGDVVVFRLPDNPGINYIKRVVGLPGDLVEYKNGRLAVTSSSNKDVTQEIKTKVLEEIQSKIESYFDQKNREKGEWVIPEGHYFMLGDNRENSQDSRFWGFVPEENLVGKVIYTL